MLFRIFIHLTIQILFVLFAYWVGANHAHITTVLLVAAIGGTYAWLFLDWLRFRRVLSWLKNGASGGFREVGMWDLLVARFKKALNERDRKIKEAQDRLNVFLAALQASPNGMILLDDEGRIEWFNHIAEVQFGLESPRDLSQHLTNLVRDPAYMAYVAKADFSCAVTMPNRVSGGGRHGLLSVQLHAYGNGRYLLLARDITLIQQAEEMRRDFVANISHEIRTPLTVLSGFIETMETIPLGEIQIKKYLDLMQRQAKRMTQLVDDLLTLSQLEDAPPPAFDEPINMSSLLNQCVQDAGDLSEVIHGVRRKIGFFCEDSITVLGSYNEIYGACFNLIANAVRYTKPDEAIEVTFEHSKLDEGAQLKVVDHGQGIAKEHLARLTERFYRVDKSRSRQTGGTGLGLAIVKHVAQRHGAHLSISSELGRGSIFSIAFPKGRVG